MFFVFHKATQERLYEKPSFRHVLQDNVTAGI